MDEWSKVALLGVHHRRRLSVSHPALVDDLSLVALCFSQLVFPLLFIEALSPATASVAFRAAHLACASTDGHVRHGQPKPLR